MRSARHQSLVLKKVRAELYRVKILVLANCFPGRNVCLMRKTDKARVSLAGEFAVLSQLALQGKDANMTLGNTKGVDILVSDPITGKMLKLEVKTNYRNEPRSEVARSEIFGDVLNCSGWILKKGNGNYDEKKDSNLFYCFVNIIKETKQCRFF